MYTPYFTYEKQGSKLSFFIRRYNKKHIDYRNKDHKEIKAILFREKGQAPLNEVIEIWERLNILLDQINLTKIDNKKDYDNTDIEEENRVQNV